MDDRQVYGAVEIGGTKVICALGKRDGTILEKVRFPTLPPKETVPKIVDFFEGKGISALSVGTVGPVNLRPGPDYGTILACPREAWSFYPLGKSLEGALHVPVVVDSDVNVACMGEARFGAGIGKQNVLYITVGTGIGIGIVIDGKPLHGLLHPEGGHSKVSRHPDDNIDSVCRFHPDCAEGMASGPAMGRRCARLGEEIPDDDPAWEIEAFYLAQLVRNCMQVMAPNVIVMGGGVMEREALFPMIRKKVLEQLGGHFIYAESSDMDTYIVPSPLKGEQALKGCLAMAADTFGQPSS
ncbi:MAG: ROK family protein [Candidatus Methanomethylophilaceae archaeon]|nr:ROK family protein [Candidatus Methanomethylophilaceae archaeon]